jgi:hypothetical protein
MFAIAHEKPFKTSVLPSTTVRYANPGRAGLGKVADDDRTEVLIGSCQFAP